MDHHKPLTISLAKTVKITLIGRQFLNPLELKQLQHQDDSRFRVPAKKIELHQQMKYFGLSGKKDLSAKIYIDGEA